MSWTNRLDSGSGADSKGERPTAKQPTRDKLFERQDEPDGSSSSCLAGSSRTSDHFSWLSNNVNSSSGSRPAKTGTVTAAALTRQKVLTRDEANNFEVALEEDDKKFNSYHREDGPDKGRLSKPNVGAQCAAGLVRPQPTVAAAAASLGPQKRESSAKRANQKAGERKQQLLFNNINWRQQQFEAPHAYELEHELQLGLERLQSYKQPQQQQGQALLSNAATMPARLEFARGACCAPSSVGGAASAASSSSLAPSGLFEILAGSAGKLEPSAACKRSEPMHKSDARRSIGSSTNNNNNNTSGGATTTNTASDAASPDANTNEEHFQEALSCDDGQFGSSFGVIVETDQQIDNLGLHHQASGDQHGEQDKQDRVDGNYGEQGKQSGELVLVSKSTISNLSNQIAFSLNKMKDLEKQVRILPQLQRQLEHMSASSATSQDVLSINNPESSSISVDSLGASYSTFYDQDDSGLSCKRPTYSVTSDSSGCASRTSSQRYLEAHHNACKCNVMSQRHEENLHHLSLQRRCGGSGGLPFTSSTGQRRSSSSAQLISSNGSPSVASFARCGLATRSGSGHFLRAKAPLQEHQHEQQQQLQLPLCHIQHGQFGQSGGEASSSSTLNDRGSSRLDYEDLLDDLLSLSYSVNYESSAASPSAGTACCETPLSSASQIATEEDDGNGDLPPGHSDAANYGAVGGATAATCGQLSNQQRQLHHQQRQHQQAFGLERSAASLAAHQEAPSAALISARVGRANRKFEQQPFEQQQQPALRVERQRSLLASHSAICSLPSQSQSQRQSEQVSETSANIATNTSAGAGQQSIISKRANNNNKTITCAQSAGANLTCRVSPTTTTRLASNSNNAQQASGQRACSQHQQQQHQQQQQLTVAPLPATTSGRLSSSPSSSTPTTPTNYFNSNSRPNSSNARRPAGLINVNRTLTRSRDNQLEFLELAATNRNSSTSNISQILSGLTTNNSNNHPSSSATGLLLKSHTRSNSMILDQPSKQNQHHLHQHHHHQHQQDTTVQQRLLAGATNSFGRPTSHQHHNNHHQQRPHAHNQRQPSGSASLQASPVRFHLDCGCQSIRDHLKYNTISRENRLNMAKSQTLAATNAAPSYEQQISNTTTTHQLQPKSNKIDAASNTDLTMTDIITKAELHEYLAKINSSSKQQNFKHLPSTMSSTSSRVQVQLPTLELKDNGSSQVCLSSSSCHKSSGSSSSQATSSSCSSESDDACAMNNRHENLGPLKVSVVPYNYNDIVEKQNDINISTERLSSLEGEDKEELSHPRGEKLQEIELATSGVAVGGSGETTDQQSEEEACSLSGAVEPFSLGSSYQDPSDFEEYYAYEESLAEITRNIKSQASLIPESFKLALAKLSDHIEQSKYSFDQPQSSSSAQEQEQQQQQQQKPPQADLVDIIRRAWFEVAAEKESAIDKAKVYIEYMQSSFTKHLLDFVINLSDNAGNTATHYAASHLRLDIIKLLLTTKVCNVNKCNRAGYTPSMLLALIELASSHDQDIARQLFSLADVNIKSRSSGQTALMLAASHGRLQTCKLLLECGADPSLIDYDGSTALMCGSEIGSLDVVKCLLANCLSDPAATDNDGLDALQIAMNNGHKNIALFLCEAKKLPRLATNNRDRPGLGGRTIVREVDGCTTHAGTVTAAASSVDRNLNNNHLPSDGRRARNGDDPCKIRPINGHIGASLRRRRGNTANTFLKRADSLMARARRQ